jgi:predicted nucleic acid-binding protein
MKEYLSEIRENVNELERIQRLNESKDKQILSLENIKDIPKMINFWTGL